MANYLLLYTGGPGGMPEGEDGQKAEMDAWGAWFGALGDDLIDGGNPFSGNTSTLKPDGSTSAGSSVPGTGYSVIKADSLEEAAEKAKGCPALQHPNDPGVVIFETFNAM
jgi:hypothetical protein